MIVAERAPVETPCRSEKYARRPFCRTMILGEVRTTSSEEACLQGHQHSTVKSENLSSFDHGATQANWSCRHLPLLGLFTPFIFPLYFSVRWGSWYLVGRRRQRCLLGAAASHLELGLEPPNDHQGSSRASAKQSSWHALASNSSSQIGAQRLALCPCLCPRDHRQSRANKLLRAAGKSCPSRNG